jgi:hypothetical protein
MDIIIVWGIKGASVRPFFASKPHQLAVINILFPVVFFYMLSIVKLKTQQLLY